jgi:NADH dehydrogenase FAD-containing subunit
LPLDGARVNHSFRVSASFRVTNPFRSRFGCETGAFARLWNHHGSELTSTAVAGCDAMGVATADGRRFEGATIVWAAGVTASPAANWLGAPRDRAGRVAVATDLSVRGAADIYVIGDVAPVLMTSWRPRSVSGTGDCRPCR